MANIVSKVTNGRILILGVDTNPASGGGTPAPIGSLAMVYDGTGTFTKTGATDTGWSANPSAPFFGVARYIYLVRDASDAARLGGSSNNVYTTFQTAYDAANALQVTLGGANIVVIMVGNTTAATAGNVSLGAAWNTSVEISGISSAASVLGTITSTSFAVAITFSNVTLGAITTTGGGVTLTARNAVAGNIITTSVTGASGNFLFSNSYNSSCGSITANASLGNCGTVTFTNCKNVSTSAITTNQTSAIASFSVGVFSMTTCDNIRFTSYTASLAFATSTGAVGGLNINNTNTNILFSGAIVVQGYTNNTNATSNVPVSNFIANNVTFNGNVHVNSRDIGSTLSHTGGIISNVNIDNCTFNGARNRLFYNATSVITGVTYTIRNIRFNSLVAGGGLYSFIYNTTFTNINIEDCSIIDTTVGIAIDNSTSPEPLLDGTGPAIIQNISGVGTIIINAVQTVLGFDAVKLKNVNISTVSLEVVGGETSFNLINCNCTNFIINASIGLLTERSKLNNCDGNLDSDGNVPLTINTSSLVFVSSGSNYDVLAYTSTLNFYAIGAITIAGILYTSNIIRKNTSTLTATLNNSYDQSLA